MKVLLIIALVALVIWLAIAIIVATDLIIDMYPKTRLSKKLHSLADGAYNKVKNRQL